jgi:hypothetical protein
MNDGGLSLPELATILTTIAVAAIHAGIQIGKISALSARVKALEGGNRDGKRRLGALGQQMAIVEYKLFGRHSTIEAPVGADDNTPT